MTMRAFSSFRLRATPRGQAMVEYASISAILTVGLLAVTVNWSTPGTTGPITQLFFEALQGYVDLMFYALNLAVG